MDWPNHDVGGILMNSPFGDNKKNIALFPYESDSNKYIALMKTAYERLGLCVVPFVGWRSKKYDFIVLNWYESVRDIKLYIRRLTVLVKLAVEKKRIIWTLHNKEPHEIKNRLFSKSLIKILLHISYKVIIHSKSTTELVKYFKGKQKLVDKVIFVPHPNYIDEYGEGGYDCSVIHNDLRLLFLGQVKPYKNIELLIEVVKELNLPNLKLKICGNADIPYQKSLRELVDFNDAIMTDFGFINDNDVADIIASSHLLVLPYSLKSSLNSGTVILAFSYKRTVLCPLIGTLADIADKTLFFSYEYLNKVDHKQQLKKQLLYIYHRYKNNYGELLGLGERCYQYVKNNNGMENTVEALAGIFKS
jgi:glycosyltransferase involved in cell wall biosynthesis